MNIQINYPPKLKAISIHVPFAYAICIGVKGKQAIFWGAKTDAEKVAFTLASEQIREYLLNVSSMNLSPTPL